MSYFIWNGIDSRNMHITQVSPVPIVRPEERVQHVTIPGRAGDVTVTEGDNVWNSYIQTAHLAVRGQQYVRAVENWLSGTGAVTFSAQPTMQQDARVVGAVTLEKHSPGMDAWEGDVQFYCNPIKRLLTEADVTVTESGTIITNDGDMTAYPLIEVHGLGLITISCGGNVLTIPECPSDWVIDCENQWITQGGVPLGGVCSGDFPVLLPGENLIAWTGAVDGLIITKRTRFL